jgi:hypothetical protein
LLEPIDVELLYLIAEAEKTNQPVSTWFLASQNAKTSSERNKLDGLYRYHLEALAKKHLVKKHTYTKGKQKLTSYAINPKRYVCLNGSLIILSNPITVIACPHVEKCPSHCQVNIRKRNGNYKISGCALLEEASDELKQQVYQCLKTTEKTELTADPSTLKST